jgi:hypothetical protein
VEILDKKIDDKLTSEDLVKSFQNLFTAIDSVLERVDRRMLGAA